MRSDGGGDRRLPQAVAPAPGPDAYPSHLGFFPQYIALFAAGVWAYRNDWLPDLPRSLRRTWARNALLAIFALPVMMASLGPEPALSLVFGGWHWQAAAFALWEAFYAVGMSVTLLGIFRIRAGRRSSHRYCESRNFALALFVV
jgi:glucan biosynthesis protein C